MYLSEGIHMLMISRKPWLISHFKLCDEDL